jgi:hypothetical protein
MKTLIIGKINQQANDNDYYLLQLLINFLQIDVDQDNAYLPCC